MKSAAVRQDVNAIKNAKRAAIKEIPNLANSS